MNSPEKRASEMTEQNAKKEIEAVLSTINVKATVSFSFPSNILEPIKDSPIIFIDVHTSEDKQKLLDLNIDKCFGYECIIRVVKRTVVAHNEQF